MLFCDDCGEYYHRHDMVTESQCIFCDNEQTEAWIEDKALRRDSEDADDYLYGPEFDDYNERMIERQQMGLWDF